MGDAADAESDKAAFSFKIAGKGRPKVVVNVEEKKGHRQLFTGVSDNGVMPAAGHTDAGQKEYVIPKLQNTYKTGVGKFVPSFVPESSSTAVTGNAEDRYERAAAPDQPTITSFGLEVRKRQAASESANGSADGRPLVPVSSKDEAAQLKEDLEQLPEEASVEDYEALPVEEFGKALLRGLGWSDGQGLGRKRQVVEPKQVIRRPDRLGLGANPAAPPPDKRPRKMGDKPKQDLVAAPAADGSMRHRVGLDEKLVPRSALQAGPVVGKLMEVVGGRHRGLLCEVKQLIPQQEGTSGPGSVLVELKPSSEVVTVSADELCERGSSKAAANNSRSEQQQQQQQQRGQDRVSMAHSRERQHSGRDGEQDKHKNSSRGGKHDEGSRHRSRSRDRDRQQHSHGSEQRHSSSRHVDNRREGYADDRRQQQQQQQQPRAVPRHKLWVAPMIRVRVVDKRAQGGRLYLKKGVVLDVAPDGSCDVRMEEGRQVVNVHQDQLETVVPKDAGAAVMVLQGPHKGRKGRLLQVSLNSGAAALQLVGDMAVERMLLDDVAQYTGHLEDEDD